MGKKKEDAPPPGSPAWMATFSDLMNLLLCFFVLLFSMSSTDAAKFEEVANSFASTFSVFTGGGSSVGDGVLVSNGVSQLSELSVYFSSMGRQDSGKSDNEIEENSKDAKDKEASGGTGESVSENEAVAEAQRTLEEAQLKASEELAEKIEEALEDERIAANVDVDYNSQYVLLTMNGALLFDSGRASIKDESEPFVNKIGKILERYAESTIEIEGHTDNVPVSSRSAFKSNDELSGARALSVFEYLVDNTSLDPAVIKHSGRGEYIPVADNSTPEGRAKNRRVEVKIYNGLSDAS
ncbi:chemotaxis protein MotB [Lachnospiraceae bacterium]|nr:chemotaxis protein MotB [Lachnospiraceae bacterium]